MPKKLSLTLAGADQLITQYKRKLWGTTPAEIAFLDQIQNRIRGIHVFQRGWLKVGGLVADFYNGVSSDKPTQKQLIEEADETQKKSFGYLNICLDVLDKNIQTELETENLRQSYQKLLLDLLMCFQAVSAELQQLNGIKYSSKSVETYRGLSYLGGRYLPFFQTQDPLHGAVFNGEAIVDFEGYCSGYVEVWGNEIQKYGWMASLPRLDVEVFTQQHKKPDLFQFPAWKESFHSSTDFKKLVKRLLNRIDETKLYKLVLDSDIESDNAHAMGIRYIKSENESESTYELFDPNFGIVVFNDKQNFTTWLAHYLCDNNFSILTDNKVVKGHLSLDVIGNQPSSAKASIPILTAETSDKTKSPTFYARLIDTPSANKDLKDISFFERSLSYFPIGGNFGFFIGLAIALAILSFSVTPLTAGIAGIIFLTSIGIGVGIGLYLAKKDHPKRIQNSFFQEKRSPSPPVEERPRISTKTITMTKDGRYDLGFFSKSTQETTPTLKSDAKLRISNTRPARRMSI